MKAVVLLLMAAIACGAGAEESDEWTGASIAQAEMATLPSFVPDGEKYIHIGGGFFSTFDMLTGHVAVPGTNEHGTIRLALESLGWESRFVYLPQGSCTLSVPGGEEVTAEMTRLDYVQEPGTGRALYRLCAQGRNVRMTVIADCENPTVSRPVLHGAIFVWSEAGASVSLFHLCGRDEREAERHLNRVVFPCSESL